MSKESSSAHCDHVQLVFCLSWPYGGLGMLDSYLEGIVLQPQGLINADLSRGARRDLACAFVEGDGLEGCLIAIVQGLVDGSGAAEDSEGVASSVHLWQGRVSDLEGAIMHCSLGEELLTLMCRESQQPVARPWRRDRGLPGRTALILPTGVASAGGACLDRRQC
jgi:hypothetical protein